MKIESIISLPENELVALLKDNDHKMGDLSRNANQIKQEGNLNAAVDAYNILINHLLGQYSLMRTILNIIEGNLEIVYSHVILQEGNLQFMSNVIAKEISISYNQLADIQISLYEPKMNSAIHSLLESLMWGPTENTDAITNIWYSMEIVGNYLATKKVVRPKNKLTENWMINHNKGYEYLKTPNRDTKKALYFYTEATNIISSEASSWHGLGLTYSCIGYSEQEKAIECWQKCYELDHDYNFEYRCIIELQ